MRVVGNIVHLLTGGILLSLGWCLAGLLYRVPAVTRPLAAPCFELARLCLWPSGRVAVRNLHVEQYRSFVRTGQTGDRALPKPAAGPHFVQAALWLPAAVILILGHAVHGLLLAVPVLANPWETRNFSLLGPAAFPLGVRVAEPAQARAMRLIGLSRRGPRYPPPIRPNHPITLACRRVARPMATIAAACLILWASSSNNEAHLYPEMARLDVLQQLAVGGGGDATGRSAVASFPDARPARREPPPGRPHASPSLPIAPAVAAPLPAADAPCSAGAPAAPVATAHLSRKQPSYGARPLGSMPIRNNGLRGDAVPLRHALNVQRWAGSVGNAKTAKPLCIEAIARQVVKSTEFAARSAAAKRLARKAAPAAPSVIAGRALSQIGPVGGHPAQLRHVARLQRWTLPATYAKADAITAPDAAAERIARSAALPDNPVVDYRSASRAVRDAVLPRARGEHPPSPEPAVLQRVADLTAKFTAQ